MKNFKKIMALMLAAMLTLAPTMAVNTMAANSATITISVDKATVNVGDEVHCKINVSDNTGWGSITFGLVYDNKVLQYVSHTAGSAIGGAGSSLHDNDGEFKMAIYVSTLDNITENGTLADITFKAVGEGSTGLTSDKEMEEMTTADLEPLYLDVKVNECTVTVAKKVTTTSTTTTTTTATTTTTTETSTQPTTSQTTTKAPVTQTTTKAPATQTTTKAPTTQTTTKAPVSQSTTQTVTEKPTETTTKAPVTETGTETTTKKPASGGRGPSGGGGGSSSSSNKTTTEATTVKSEPKTEATTANAEPNTTGKETTPNTIPEVKVAIGKDVISIDGKDYKMDASAYIQSESNSTLVPLRFVAVVLSGDDIENADNSKAIAWDAAAKQATVTKDNMKAVFTAGSNIVEVNGVKTAMENGVKAEIKDGRMYVPFRAIGNFLDVQVDWDAETKTAIYKAK